MGANSKLGNNQLLLRATTKKHQASNTVSTNEMASIVHQAILQDFTKFTYGALCCPCYMIITPNIRRIFVEKSKKIKRARS